MNRPKGKERWIHCYKSSQKILLVGEGDFSFSACLARAFRTAENIVATSYLKRESLRQQHWTSIPHLDELESLGCLLLYKVDVYKMHAHPILKDMKFDIIIFNFPHAGHYDYLCERDVKLIEMHMNLVEAYFQSASKMLTEKGEVHLRHREDSPYDSWNVVLLAGKAGLTLKEKVIFNKSDYPGYHNKRGGGIKTNKTFPIIHAYTYKFAPYLPNDLSKKDEVHVLEMNNQANHDDKIQLICEKDTVYDDHVNVSKIKEEDQGQQHLESDKVDDLLEKDEANDDIFVQKNDQVHLVKSGRADVDLPNSDVSVNALDLHVLEMVDACKQCAMSDKVDDQLSKKVDDEVHVDLELLKIIDDGDLSENDGDFDIPRVDNNQMNIEFQKLGPKHLRNDDDVGDDHDQQHFKNEEVHDHSLTSEEMDSDLLRKDEVDSDLLDENKFVMIIQKM